MPGSWHDEYREAEYAPSVSVFSGYDLLPDQTLHSPSDYILDQTMGQQHDDIEALAGAGSLLPLSMAHLDVNTSPTLNFSVSQQEADNIDFTAGVTNLVDVINMKRPHDFDTFVTPHKKTKSISHRSDPPYGTLSSPGSSYPLTRGLSSGAHSSQYPPLAEETFDQDTAQSQASDIDWQPQSQPARSDFEIRRNEKQNSTTEKSKKKKKQHHCMDGCPEKAFTTSNDLERHRRTVHNKINKGERVWSCIIGNCSTGRKVWARMDNFKQHMSRMHNQNNAEIVEQMAVSYDPTLHELQAGKKRLNQSHKENTTDNPVDLAAQALDTSFDFKGSQEMWSQEPTEGSTSRINIARSQNNSLSPATSSLKWRSQQAQQQGSQSLHVNRQSQRRPPATVANPENLAHQRYEMRMEDSTPVSAFPPRSSQYDLVNVIGPESAPGFEGNVFPNQIEMRRSSHPETFNSGLSPIIESGFLQMVEKLSPDQRLHLRNILDQRGAPANQMRQRSASTSKLQTIKKTDSVKDDMTLVCSKSGCGKRFNKNAELRKHEARHARKYFCTFDECFKKFGTKWEWKRHERSQHTQAIEWRCDVKDSERVCGQSSCDETKFVTHLKVHHGLTGNASVHKKLETCLLAKNWIGSFWCGFCAEIIHNPELMGTDSLKARYGHIAEHIDSKERSRNMSHWVEVRSGGKTKAEIQQAMDGFSLQSPSSEMDNSGTPTDQNEGESFDEDEGEDEDEDYESEEGSSQDNDVVGVQNQSCHLSTTRATASQASHGQSESHPGTQKPETTLTPPGYHGTQANFLGEQFYNNDTQQMLQPNFGNHGYANHFARLCDNCGLGLVLTPSGEYYCECHFLHLENM